MRKYELLLLTTTFQHQRDLADIIAFITELFEQNDRKKLWMTYEMTLFIYNIILNTSNDYDYLIRKKWKEVVKKKVMHVIKQIYGEEQLTEENIIKIENDIKFIEQTKQYTYIYDIILYIYFFFFSTG